MFGVITYDTFISDAYKKKFNLPHIHKTVFCEIIKLKYLSYILHLIFLCSVHTQILQSKIWSSHNGVGEDSGRLGCDTKLSSQKFLMFQRIIVPSTSGSSSPRRTAMILCNKRKYRPINKVPHPQRPDSKYCEACLLKYKGNYWDCMTFHSLLQMFIF
jgi:hypothetical protein